MTGRFLFVPLFRKMRSDESLSDEWAGTNEIWEACPDERNAWGPFIAFARLWAEPHKWQARPPATVRPRNTAHPLFGRDVGEFETDQEVPVRLARQCGDIPSGQ